MPFKSFETNMCPEPLREIFILIFCQNFMDLDVVACLPFGLWSAHAQIMDRIRLLLGLLSSALYKHVKKGAYPLDRKLVPF